ncbi:MAG: 3-keto-disaccharide hydrolase [Gemmatimonadales bacterium]
MRRTIGLCLPLLAFAAVLHAQNPNPVPGDPSPWKQHSMDRPAPPVVTPGPYLGPVAPPSDATVLFDGRSLAEWRAADTTKGAAKWVIENGAMVVAPSTGDIATRRSFGDMQLHVEWSAPNPPTGEGQDRGNSGVFLMSTYEIQVLDSYHAATYPDGQAAAIYGEFPPLVNAMRPPGDWQVYDIVFHRPHFDAGGKVTIPARVTVFHNGILVQDDVAILGPTTNGHRTAYLAQPDRLPLQLQDHGHRVRYRNIWVRELPARGR